MIVRQACVDDARALAGLRRAWAAETDGPVEDAGFEDSFVDWFARESARRVTWILEGPDGPAGMMNLAVFERMPRPGRPPRNWGYVGNAFVLRAHRNQGWGSRLLDGVIAYARDRDLARLVLSPSARSVPFYRRAGFRGADELLVLSPIPAARRSSPPDADGVASGRTATE